MGNSHNDAFISYSSKDREWAELLEQNLKNKGFSPFLDRKRLIAGDDWEESLLEALWQSRHLIVLWSENANQSKWVIEEHTRFDQIRRDFQREGRMITILLEGENMRFHSYQVIKDLQKKGAYAAGVAALDENVWQEVMMQVEEALTVDDSSTPIPLAIITTTRERLKNIDPDKVPEDGAASLNDLLNSLKLGTRDNLLQYYGDTRTDWQPFGGNTGKNIMTIMNNLRDDINRKNPNDKIRWKLIDDIFWSNKTEDREKVEREVEKLLPSESDAKGLAVVVIDPISFYDPLVSGRFNNQIYRCLYNSKCLIMILPPFPIPLPNSGLRELLKNKMNQVYNHFYLYIDRYIPAENCNLYISEDIDIKRFLVWALRSHIQRQEPAKSVTFTNF